MREPILCVRNQRIGFFMNMSKSNMGKIGETIKSDDFTHNCDIVVNMKPERTEMNQSKLSRKSFCLIMATGLCVLMAVPAYSATYYVRVDGGSSTECTGLADAPYLGSGSNQNCAFSHPFWAVSPKGDSSTKITGGDTLIIDGSNNSEYRIGWGAPNTGRCNSSWPWDCYMNAIPSGPDPANPTRILGKGWDTGCSNPPELWGTQRTKTVLNLRGSNNIEVQCLEITDHKGCVEFHPVLGCRRSGKAPELGDWAERGIIARDSSSVLLKNVRIHGLSHTGIHAGRLRDWTLDTVEIVGNGWVGWDGDIGKNESSNSGTMMFDKVRIEWNGCVETYPQETPTGCWSQSQGGYGDGMGTGLSGADWIFNESNISHNTSDGLDLLYHDGNGTITIKRSRFEGNAGNQVKIGTGTVIENSVIIGNCSYFSGQSFTLSPGFDNCRAQGNAIGFSPKPNHFMGIYNSTVTSNGDCLVISGAKYCDGSEVLIARNNIFSAGRDYHQSFENSCFYSCGQLKFDEDYSIISNVKNSASVCGNKGANSICANPQFKEPSVQYYRGAAFDVNLKSTSPAIGKAIVLTGKSSLDYVSNERGNVWDIGAIEYDLTFDELTCVDGIEHCLTQEDCTGQGYYWYNDICDVNPEPLPTCAEDILYCGSPSECTGQGYHWYDKSRNFQKIDDNLFPPKIYCSVRSKLLSHHNI